MNRKTTLAMGAAAMTMVAAGSASSCNLVLGLDAYYDCPEDPKCPPATTSTTTNTTTSSNAGGAPPEVCAVNGVRDDKETDVDCGGGICGPCDDGKACSSPADCVNQVCTTGICKKPGCGDGVQNGEETDVDCGGTSCTPCGPDLGCFVDGDCVSAQCANGTCASICNDLAKGGKETDVDCGGDDCAPCADAKGCKTGPDCQSGVCQGAVCQKNYVWGKDLGLSSIGAQFPLAATSTPGVLLAGSANGNLNLGSGPIATTGAFVASFYESGSEIWHSVSVQGAPNVSSVASTANGGSVIAGSFQDTISFFGAGSFMSVGGLDMFVSTVKAGGLPGWAKSFGDVQDIQIVSDIVVDSADNVILVGVFQGSVDFGGGKLTSKGTLDAFVTKLDSSGNHVWSKQFGSAGQESGQSVAVDANDNIIMSAGTSGPVDFGGGAIGGSGSVIVKLDPMGNHQWSKSFSGANIGFGSFLRTDSMGNVVAGGDYFGAVDFGGGALPVASGSNLFVAKLDPMGNHLWSHGYGSLVGQQMEALAVGPQGDVAVTGAFKGQVDYGGGMLMSAGGYDAFVFKLDAAGHHIWSRRFGDAQDQYGVGVAIAGSKLYLSGTFAGAIDFGGGMMTAPSGSSDGFLAQFTAP